MVVKSHAETTDLLFKNSQQKIEQSKIIKVNDDASRYLNSTGYIYSYYFEPLGSSAPSLPENQTMLPAASLLKVQRVMALLRASEEGKADLKKKITIQKSWLNDGYGSLWQKGAGYKITPLKAAELSLVDSDNTAINVVGAALEGEPPSDNVFTEINFRYKISDNRLLTSAASYSGFFRCLYQSCYLNQKDSQWVLKELTKTEFPGIKDGVPSEVTVSHKIGDTDNTYDDCGIVYLPKQPYLLCVMIGVNRAKAVPIIANLSRTIYSGILN